MAGSFFHLLLAFKAWSEIVPCGEEESERERQGAFLAGSLAPDIGLFPGGPELLSERVHRERSGDFLRALWDGAKGGAEEAFAAGWGLHLYTDLAVHPWVTECADYLFKKLRRGYPDLWHMRVEWGVDCALLEQEEMAFLWDACLHFPRREGESSLLSLVGAKFYREDAQASIIARGERSVARWMKWLPWLFLWCGRIYPEKRRGIPLLTPWLRKLTEKVLGEWLEDVEGYKIQVALATSWSPDPDDVQLVLDLGEKGLDAFKRDWAEGFASFGNADMEKGTEI